MRGGTSQPRVERGDRFRQPAALVALLGERGARFAELDRARGDARVEQRIRALEIGNPLRAVDRALDPGGEQVEGDGLGEVIVGAGC